MERLVIRNVIFTMYHIASVGFCAGRSDIDVGCLSKSQSEGKTPFSKLRFVCTGNSKR